MTTTWSISTLERETSNGFVATAHCQATEDALATNIALQKNPVTATGTHWGQA